MKSKKEKSTTTRIYPSILREIRKHKITPSESDNDVIGRRFGVIKRRSKK